MIVAGAMGGEGYPDCTNSLTISLRRRPASNRRAITAIAATTAVVLATGGIPGAVLRPISYDLGPLAPGNQGLRRDGTLLVKVRTAGGGALIDGAEVRAYALLDDVSYLADVRRTDKAGSALIKGLPDGVVWVVADAPGRARASTRLVVDAERREITMALEEEHRIDVVVKDDGDAPIAAVDVEVLSAADPLPVGARSGGDGIAHVARLSAGPWRVTARAAGYEEGSARATNDGDILAITLRKLGSFSVHVVGDGDKAVARARVLVAGAMLWPPRAAETNAAGDVRIGGLAAGVYALRASSGDLVSTIDLGIALGRGEQKSVVLKVARGYWIGVRVTDGDTEDAVGIRSARVTLAEGGLSPFPIEATTDLHGGSRLGPIAAGAATLSVRADGFVPRGIALPDLPPADVRVGLVRAGVLAGRVVDERGFPIDGATIEIVGTDPNGGPILDDPRRASFQAAHFDAMLGGPTPLMPAGQLGVMPGPVPPIPQSGMASGAIPPQLASLHGATTEVEPWVTRSDGTFRAAPASPGRLRAIVRHPQYIEAESDVVTLAPGGEAQVDVVMQAGGALEGRVFDANDRPVEGARILVSAAHGSLERATRTASDGTFAFAALPDAVSLTTSLDESTDQPDIRLSIIIPARGRKEVTIRLPEPRRPLAVNVTDERAFPIGTAQV
ncbi:MAG: carboxypeptidase-like regulatory domain-containing protein, partial [Myxococcota bacterium]|nr:carboxypeptidase-like regulatory domain-containing protein [Myxococcota bacterium]